MTQVIKMKPKVIFMEERQIEEEDYTFFESLNLIDFRDDLSYK